MNREQKAITIADILRLPPTPDGASSDQVSWVNGVFEAYVSDSKPGQTQSGSNYVSMTLLDPSDGSLSLSCTIWGLTVPPVQGTYLTMSGQGIIRKEYNGTAQISVKIDKVTITPIAGPTAQTSVQGELPVANNPTQAQAAPPVQPSAAPTTRAQGSPPGTPRFSGPMVGGAVKEAVKIITGIQRGDEFYDSSDFLNLLHKITSHVLRVQERIQTSGKIADKPGESIPMGNFAPPPGQLTTFDGAPIPQAAPKASGPPPGTPVPQTAPAPQTPNPRPEPGPGGSVMSDIDEDVPF